jgi:hypothetical protein
MSEIARYRIEPAKKAKYISTNFDDKLKKKDEITPRSGASTLVVKIILVFKLETLFLSKVLVVLTPSEILCDITASATARPTAEDTEKATPIPKPSINEWMIIIMAP